MNHYKKSALLKRIKTLKKEIAKIEEDNTESMEEAISKRQTEISEFIAKLSNTNIIKEFNDYYRERLLKRKLSKLPWYIPWYTMLHFKEKRNFIKQASKIEVVKIKNNKKLIFDNSHDNRNHLSLIDTFIIYLQNRGIEYIKPKVIWFGILQSTIDRYKDWLDEVEMKIDCIEENKIEVAYLNEDERIFKKINMYKEMCHL